jgi:hypothetical protein
MRAISHHENSEIVQSKYPLLSVTLQVGFPNWRSNGTTKVPVAPVANLSISRNVTGKITSQRRTKPLAASPGSERHALSGANPDRVHLVGALDDGRVGMRSLRLPPGTSNLRSLQWRRHVWPSQVKRRGIAAPSGKALDLNRTARVFRQSKKLLDACRIVRLARRHLIEPIDSPKPVQKLRITKVETCNLAKLGAITVFMLDDFAPDFDFAE